MCALPMVSVGGITDATWVGTAQGVIRVAPEERLRREQQHHQGECADAIGGAPCRHVPEAHAPERDRGVASGLCRWLCAMAKSTAQCGACRGALAAVVQALPGAVYASIDKINFRYDALKGELVTERGRRKRKHDEDYKKEATSGRVAAQLGNSGLALCKLDGVDPKMIRRQEVRTMRLIQTAAFRPFSTVARGTFHMAEDGKRLGRPPRETEHYVLSVCTSVGSSWASYLPPQVALM